MSERSFDFKKEYRELYLPGSKSVLVDVPLINFIMIDGFGDPNNSEEFEHAVEALYGLSFTIKMSKMKGDQPPGYFEYVVPPLEGLWWIDDGRFSFEQRQNWRYTLMIRQPDFVDKDFFEWACGRLRSKKPKLPVDNLRYEAFREGLCVQIMHIGPYSTEPETMAKVGEFLAKESLREKLVSGGKHHEIYLSDPRKSKQETMKTVLRHPVEKI
jgi:hypothetical protein